MLSVLVYWLLTLALDPLDDLRTTPALNRDQLIELRMQQLNLDEPWYVAVLGLADRLHPRRLRGGLAHAANRSTTCSCGAVSTSIQLVFAATCIALFVGRHDRPGLSALRQYTTFDYAITFVSFVLFALPVFWVAVLLKQFLAIGFNDYLDNPTMNWPAVIGFSVVVGALLGRRIATEFKRQAIIFLAPLPSRDRLCPTSCSAAGCSDPRIGRDRRLPASASVRRSRSR